MIRVRYADIAPTVFEIAISLSLSTAIRSGLSCPMWLTASMDIPLGNEPSPTTATTCHDSPLRSRAAAMPTAEESAVPAWPVWNQSCGLSCGLGNPDTPPNLRSVPNASRRPVMSLCA